MAQGVVTIASDVHSDKVAIEWKGECLTYGVIRTRVSTLASHLRAHKCGADTIIAVCLPRSFALVVAAHAVQEAGSAYLPVDPLLPAARRECILQDARPLVCIAVSDIHGFDTIVVQESGECALLAEPEILAERRFVAYFWLSWVKGEYKKGDRKVTARGLQER